MNQYDIYWAEIELQDSRDRRPVLILSPQWYIDEQPQDSLLIAPVSAQMDLLDRRRHFLINNNDPDFPETHLKKGSYIALDYSTPLRRECIFGYVGCLDGDLVRRFKSFWLGFYGVA